MTAYLLVDISTVILDTHVVKRMGTCMTQVTGKPNTTDTVWGTLPYTIEYFLPQYMDMTERLGTRYAKRNNVDLDESIAEARYQLVLYFVSPSFQIAGYEEVIMKNFIYRGVIQYFQGNTKKRRAIYQEKRDYGRQSQDDNPKQADYKRINSSVMQDNMDEEMLTWLSGYIGNDHYAFRILEYLKQGLPLADLELFPGRRTQNRYIPNLVKDRLIRLCKLGDRATRKVKFAETEHDRTEDGEPIGVGANERAHDTHT